MTQITGALVGIALVLSAVFVPMAFFGGSTGAIYRQFSLTIVSAMVLSVLVALILTPALCATLLKPMKHGEFGAQRGFFGWFNRFFDTNANRYQNGVRKVIKQGTRYGIIYLAMLAVLAVLFMRMPTSFLPEEDQGSSCPWCSSRWGQPRSGPRWCSGRCATTSSRTRRRTWTPC